MSTSHRQPKDRQADMTPLPFPGANEANLVAKVGASVVNGLRHASQPTPWPNTREALLELLVILSEWNERARATAFYADDLWRFRRNEDPNQHPARPSAEAFKSSNAQRYYLHVVMRDSQKVLAGPI